MSMLEVPQPPHHSSPLDGRRVAAVRIAPPTPFLAGSPAEHPPVPPSLTTATRGSVESKIDQASKLPPSSFGCYLPSLFSPKSTSSHPSTSATGKLHTSGFQPSTIHLVTAGSKQSEYHHQCFPTESPFRCGEEASKSTLYTSSNKPLVSPMSPLHRLASSTPPLKGSANMCPFQNNPTSSTLCSPLKDSTSESQSWSRRQLESSVSSSGASLPSSPMASQTSFRRTSAGSMINKSIQSLLRRSKTKQSKLGGYPSLPSLNMNPKGTEEQRVHKSNSAQSLTKAAILSSAYAHSEALSSCKSSPSVQSSFHPSPRSPLVPNNSYAAEKESSLPNCSSISESSLKSARSFYSTIDSDASYSPLSTPTFGDVVSCIPAGLPTLPECQTAIFTGSLSVSDHLNFTGDHVDVKISTSNSIDKLTPAIEVTEESDEDDLEAEDILANLRSIAATKNPRGQEPYWGSDSHSSVRRNSTVSSFNSDQYSVVDCSDARSEFSFDAAIDEEDGPDFFPLPSWPTLSSTSQSPLNNQATNSNMRSSTNCVTSTPLKQSITL